MTELCRRRHSNVLRRPQIPDRPPRRDRLGGGDYRVGVDAVVAVKLVDRAGLAEMLDAKRPHPMAADRAEPRQSRRMPIEYADDAAMPGQAGKQPLDVATGMDQAALARPAGGGPAGIETV